LSGVNAPPAPAHNQGSLINADFAGRDLTDSSFTHAIPYSNLSHTLQGVSFFSKSGVGEFGEPTQAIPWTPLAPTEPIRQCPVEVHLPPPGLMVLLLTLILPMFLRQRMSRTNCARLLKAPIQLQDAKPKNLILEPKLNKLQALDFLEKSSAKCSSPCADVV